MIGGPDPVGDLWHCRRPLALSATPGTVGGPGLSATPGPVGVPGLSVLPGRAEGAVGSFTGAVLWPVVIAAVILAIGIIADQRSDYE